MEPNEQITSVRLDQLSPEEIRRQAFLFDEVDLGRELLSIAEDKAGNCHTGTTLERRQALYDEICLRLAEGVSVRKIAKTYGVGRNTLGAIRERLVTSGKMEPYKKRVSASLARVIEGGLELLEEKIDKGDVPTNVLPVVVGVAVDKKALIDGEPTANVSVTVKAELTQKDWDAWLESLPSAKAIDAQSTGGPANA